MIIKLRIDITSKRHTILMLCMQKQNLADDECFFFVVIFFLLFFPEISMTFYENLHKISNSVLLEHCEKYFIMMFIVIYLPCRKIYPFTC